MTRKLTRKRKKWIIAGGAAAVLGTAVLTPEVFAGEASHSASTSCSAQASAQGNATASASARTGSGCRAAEQAQGQVQGQIPGQAQGQLPSQAPGQTPGQVQGQIPGQGQAQAQTQGHSLEDLRRTLDSDPDSLLRMSDNDLRTLWQNRDQLIKWGTAEGKRKGRAFWGNGAPDLNNRDAVSADANNPGAAISKRLIDQLRTMPIEQFTALRNKVMSKPNTPDGNRLKNSFWTNGCTTVGDYVDFPKAVVDACIRHDFLYTNSANYAARAGLSREQTEQLRKEADDQLHQDITETYSGILAAPFWVTLRWFGQSAFTPTPTAGPEVHTVQ